MLVFYSGKYEEEFKKRGLVSERYIPYFTRWVKKCIGSGCLDDAVFSALLEEEGQEGSLR